MLLGACGPGPRPPPALPWGRRVLARRAQVSGVRRRSRSAARTRSGRPAAGSGTATCTRPKTQGVPAPERKRVLQRLYRLERSRTTHGTGLGLSLVNAIAELHRARLTLGDAAPGLRVEVVFERLFPSGGR